MNAYELADINDWSCCAHVKEVSAMLRQQAEKIKNMEIWEKKYLDRIEALEKELKKASEK